MTAVRMLWKVVLRISLISSSVNSLRKRTWSQVVAPGGTDQQLEGTEEAGGCFFLQPQSLCVNWGLQSSCQIGTRPLPVLGVFEPKPVTVTQAHKLFQDDGGEEGAISLQHSSREQLQPSQVVGIQGSDLLQDLVRNPHHQCVSTGNSARASESLGKP